MNTIRIRKKLESETLHLPEARALIGKKKGTSVEVMAPGGPKAYEITKVEWR